VVEWEKQIAAINLVVGDVTLAADFYREVFGLQPQQEDEETAMFRFKDTYVFLQRGESHRDSPPADILDLATRGVGQFAILVEDVDAVRGDLAERGVAIISGPDDRDWGMRTMTFADPGGYTWEIAQEIPTGVAS
jgi:catechol 2,3-dioxygenase-like lactoylglutathione lyase family enzyme